MTVETVRETPPPQPVLPVVEIHVREDGERQPRTLIVRNAARGRENHIGKLLFQLQDDAGAVMGGAYLSRADVRALFVALRDHLL